MTPDLPLDPPQTGEQPLPEPKPDPAFEMRYLTFEEQHQEWLSAYGEQYVREVPLTQAQLEHEQSVALVIAKEYRRPLLQLFQYTCHDCPGRRWCTLAYDLYNTQGDCLLAK